MIGKVEEKVAPKRTPLAQRFWSKVRPAGDCWEWAGSTRKGYGIIARPGRPRGTLSAHRYAYEQMVGEVPAGLQLDHLCRNRACVNPYHLDPVTNAENHRRRTKTYLADNDER